MKKKEKKQIKEKRKEKEKEEETVPPKFHLSNRKTRTFTCQEYVPYISPCPVFTEEIQQENVTEAGRRIYNVNRAERRKARERVEFNRTSI